MQSIREMLETCLLSYYVNLQSSLSFYVSYKFLFNLFAMYVLSSLSDRLDDNTISEGQSPVIKRPNLPQFLNYMLHARIIALNISHIRRIFFYVMKFYPDRQMEIAIECHNALPFSSLPPDYGPSDLLLTHIVRVKEQVKDNRTLDKLKVYHSDFCHRKEESELKERRHRYYIKEIQARFDKERKCLANQMQILTRRCLIFTYKKLGQRRV